MSPEDAFSILEAIAEINDCTDRLKVAPKTFLIGYEAQ